jgi:hypothetical protein
MQVLSGLDFTPQIWREMLLAQEILLIRLRPELKQGVKGKFA